MAGEDNFFQKVYEVVRLIPYGRVTSYGAVARYLGSSGSARMVGWALNSSHNMDDIPAHRVVNRMGMLTGKHHFGGTSAMQQMLESEGVKVKGNTVCNFQGLLWDPNTEL